MKIVLIEDNCADRSAIQLMLEARNETVFTFDKGDDAWRFIESTPDIDVIIISLNLQDSSGLEICWHCRILAAQRKAMYVIAISEQKDAKMLVEALDSGADDFLHKPLQEEILLARLRVAERMTILQSQLVQLANHDPLTNLYNRRAFLELSHEAIERLDDTLSLAAIMFDIDHFKSVNDIYGHDSGDQVIKTVAQIANSEGCLVGRLGGEEFAVIVEGQSFYAAACLANRIRENIANTPIVVGGRKISITSSFGVARFCDGDDFESLFKRADIALYQSKQNGRNMVTVERTKPAQSVAQEASHRFAR